MTRFDFSPSFRTMLDFALHMGLVDGVEIAAMTGGVVASFAHKGNLEHHIETLVSMEIDEAAEARTHSEPEIRRIWWAVRSRCKAIALEGQRTGVSAGIDTFKFDERLGQLWREARVVDW